MTEHTREEMLQDLRKAEEKIDRDKTISKAKYDTIGNIPSWKIRLEFNGWNNAKKQAGLETNTQRHNVGREKVIEILQRHAEEYGEPIQLTEVTEKQNISQQTLKQGKAFHEICDEAGVEPLKRPIEVDIEQIVEEYYPDREKLNFIHVTRTNELRRIGCQQVAEIKKRIRESDIEYQTEKELEEEAAQVVIDEIGQGFHDAKDMRETLKEEIGIDPYKANRGIQNLYDALEEKGVRVRPNQPHGSANSAYIDTGSYDNEDAYTAFMREKFIKFNEMLGEDYELSEEYFKRAMEESGKGYSFKGTFAGLAYIDTELTQKELSERLPVSVVTVRNRYQKLVHGEDIDVDAEAVKQK